MIKARKTGIVLAALALVLAALACNFPGQEIQSQATPIPVTTEAVEELEHQLATAAVTAAQGGPVTVSITEQQLTSLIALELQKQPDTPIHDVQVLLRDGLVQVLGKIQQSGLSLDLVMKLDVQVDNQGDIQYRIVSANLGPVPLPQNTLDQLTQQLDASFGDRLREQTANMYVENVTIADGSMVITGRKR